MRRTPALIVLLQTSSDLMMRSVQTSRGTLVHPGMPCAALLHAAAPAGRAPIKEADGRAATSSTRTASGAHSVAAAVNHTASSQVFSGSRRQSAGFCSLARQQSGPATCAGSCSAAVSYVAVRRLASTAEQGAARPQGGVSEVTSVKIVKWLVIGMVVILTVRVMPYIGMGTVESALQLLTAESAFLQKAGASRLTTIASISDSGAAAAIQGDAVAKLLQVLDASPDAGVRSETVKALLQLSKVPGGELELRRLGAAEHIIQVLNHGGLALEGAGHAKQLLRSLGSHYDIGDSGGGR